MLRSACLCVALLVSVPSFAQFTTYFSEDLTTFGSYPADPSSPPLLTYADFLSHLPGAGIEDFESYETMPATVTFPLSTGDVVADFSTSGATLYSFSGAGRFATSGTQYLELTAGTQGDPETATITFSSPVAAFGFFATDLGDFGGSLKLLLTKTNGDVVEVTVPNTGAVTDAPNGALVFFGFTDQTAEYTQIQFVNESGDDVFGFDDFILGSLLIVREGTVVVVPPTMGNVVTGAQRSVFAGLFGRGVQFRRGGTGGPDAAFMPASQVRLAGWASGFGDWADRNAEDGLPGYRSRVFGATAGLEWTIDGTLLGLSLSQADQSLGADNGDDSKADSYYGSVYASTLAGPFSVDLAFSYGTHDVGSTYGAGLVKGDYSAKDYALQLSVGHDMEYKKVLLQPRVFGAFVRYEQEAYTEDVTAGTPRRIDGFESDYPILGAAVDASFDTELASVPLTPVFGLLYEHTFDGQAEWIGQSSTLGTGRMPLEAPVEDIVELSVGVEAGLSESLSMAVRLNTCRDFDGDYRSFGGAVTIKYIF